MATDSAFRNAILVMYDIVKNGAIKEYSIVDNEEQKVDFASKQIDICKKDIKTLDDVISHIKKYEPSNSVLISEVNAILNDLKQYYRTL